MSSIEFEGKEIEVQPGDTIAAAVYRAGTKVFSRSFKYHRPRGLYCLSGDCPNCLVTVDGEVNVRACECKAEAGQQVARQNAWPSVDRDALAIIDKMHFALPVGFYYKTMARPKFAWHVAEPFIRKVAGLGFASKDDRPRDLAQVNRHCEVLVIGAGVAGLAAAREAAIFGDRVLILDEHEPGTRVAPGATRAQIDALRAEVEALANVTCLWNTAAVGIYEGPMVIATTATDTQKIHPKNIVIACGGMEVHRVFTNNDVPGIMLARGAARLAGVHGVRPGDRVVVWAEQAEALQHVATLKQAGCTIVAVVASEGVDTSGLSDRVIVGKVDAAQGKKRLSGVQVGAESLSCDVLAIGSEIQSNHHLVRLAYDLPCVVAGEALGRGMSLSETLDSGAEAGKRAANGLDLYQLPQNEPPRSCGGDGYVCLCEDVVVKDIEIAVKEGFDSAELLKRYTTVTMGPCQGRLCADQLRAIAERVTPAERDRVGAPTTLRPPVRPLKMEQAAAGARHSVERHTALVDVHRGLGASMMWAGSWKRVESYNGDVQGEYEAVRNRVGLIDVGTLGKFTVAGPDATQLLERLYPMRVADLQPGRLRYGLMLEEGGVIIDDGTVCAMPDGTYYVTVTTSGSDSSTRGRWTGAHLGTDGSTSSTRRRPGRHQHRRAEDPARCLQKLSSDPLSKEGFPYIRQRKITVAGVPCTAIRLGFVGEVGWELHHAASRSEELWARCSRPASEHGIQPFGIQAQRLLRLEKGHIIVSQDTDFETTPGKRRHGLGRQDGED